MNTITIRFSENGTLELNVRDWLATNGKKPYIKKMLALMDISDNSYNTTCYNDFKAFIQENYSKYTDNKGIKNAAEILGVNAEIQPKTKKLAKDVVTPLSVEIDGVPGVVYGYADVYEYKGIKYAIMCNNPHSKTAPKTYRAYELSSGLGLWVYVSSVKEIHKRVVDNYSKLFIAINSERVKKQAAYVQSYNDFESSMYILENSQDRLISSSIIRNTTINELKKREVKAA